MNIQGWSPLGLNGLISLLSKGLFESSPAPQFKGINFQCSALLIVQISHPYVTTRKTIALMIWTFVSKVMSLLFNTLSRFVTAFLPVQFLGWEEALEKGYAIHSSILGLPCPSPTSRVCSNSCPLSWWCYLTISLSVIPFSLCPQSLLASRSFPLSWLFISGGQSIGASASA